MKLKILMGTTTHTAECVAQALLASLYNQPKSLTHVRYGVMALGDQGSYPMTFAMGGHLFDEKLQDLGAQRHRPRGHRQRLGRAWLIEHLPKLGAA